MTEIETQRASAGVFEITTDEGGTFGFGAARLFKNIESYPGQLMTVPSRMSAKTEQKYTRAQAVKAARHVERTNVRFEIGLQLDPDEGDRDRAQAPGVEKHAVRGRDARDREKPVDAGTKRRARATVVLVLAETDEPAFVVFERRLILR